MKRIQINFPSIFLGAGLMLAFAMQSAGPGQRINILTAEQRAILNKFSMVDLPDGLGETVPTIRISGVNLQIVNGTGVTSTTDGTGNLIVGYNELGNSNGDNRSGSHNLVVGALQSYTSYAGTVLSFDNTIGGPYSNIVGGRTSISDGFASAISGGFGNEVHSQDDSVSGGAFNIADSGTGASWVGGGAFNMANGGVSSIAGGINNSTVGFTSAVLGGDGNSAVGDNSTVSGGNLRTASGTYDWVAGGLFQDF